MLIQLDDVGHVVVIADVCNPHTLVVEITNVSIIEFVALSCHFLLEAETLQYIIIAL